MKTNKKTVKKQAEPVRPLEEGVTIGSFGFTVLGLRVSVERVNIRRAGTIVCTQPEVIACQTTQNTTSQRRKS